jgi:(3S)-malyl-CoA thioesterase
MWQSPDGTGLGTEGGQGRDRGIDGKTRVQPDRPAGAKAAFGPGDGPGVAVVDGKFAENLHIVTARALIARARAIAATAAE